jgi:hypothetical protein
MTDFFFQCFRKDESLNNIRLFLDFFLYCRIPDFCVGFEKNCVFFTQKIYTFTDAVAKTYGKENPIYVFLFWELGGLTYMYLLAIYIFLVSVHKFPAAEEADRLWEYINRSQTHECENLD